MAFITLTVLFVLIVVTVLSNRGSSDGHAARQFRRIGMIVAGVVLFFMLTSTVTVIKAGHVGVVDLFGQVRPATLKPGIQFVNPLAHVVQMSVQTQEIKETMNVPSKEGLTIGIEMSLLYHLNPEQAADVYSKVGQEYAGVLIEPQFRSVTRGVTASYEAKALYTSEREAIAQLILDDLKKLAEPRGVIVESTPMRSLSLPAKITSAIEDKLSADQESQRMAFILTKEKQEAERKRIEAQGVADFQRIVTDGISDKLLQWKGIEATQDLAKSSNAKIVIIGNSKNGLPLVLGDVK
ncbi:MAG TPA: prohibitin family protein [Vicinamibacterales bacterium]|nr:prohibitin family protein [Vicinamibacterales bacterium]